MSKAIVTHGWSVASLQGVAFELKIMKSVLSRAMKAGRIEKNPAVDVELPSGARSFRGGARTGAVAGVQNSQARARLARRDPHRVLHGRTTLATWRI
jgi:hypothetical protein